MIGSASDHRGTQGKTLDNEKRSGGVPNTHTSQRQEREGGGAARVRRSPFKEQEDAYRRGRFTP